MVDVWLHAIPISLICSSEALVKSLVKCGDLFHQSYEQNLGEKQVPAGKLKVVIMM